MPEPSQRLLVTTAKPQYRTRVQGSVITLLEVVTETIILYIGKHNISGLCNQPKSTADSSHSEEPSLHGPDVGASAMLPDPQCQMRTSLSFRKRQLLHGSHSY